MSEQSSKEQADILTRAKAVKVGVSHRQPTDDIIVLALAWMKDEITASQAMAVQHPEWPAYRSSNMYNEFAYGLREAYRQGRLKEVRK